MASSGLNSANVAIPAVRWLLGIQSVLSGINWWIKILPFPNIHEPTTGPVKHEILRTMVESGWMFSTTKMIEILLGLALIFNRQAVLMLVIAFPVMLMTFLLDFFPFVRAIGPFVSGDLSGMAFFHSFLDMLYFGAAVFVMQAYLMSEYFDDYRSLFSVKPLGPPAGWSGVFEADLLRTTLRWLSYTIGASSTIWAILMVVGLVPWSSLAILAPPR